MDEDGVERRFPGVLISGKYHADHPEENNVIPCHKHICRIEVVQILCLLRPAKRRERPERGGEPCIQRILVLGKMCAPAVRAFLRRMPVHDELAALVAVICRDAVSPPDLPGDTPVLDIFQPVQIDLVKTLRHKFQLACLQRVDGRFCQFFHLHEPLLFDQRLHSRAAAVMSPHGMCVRNDFYEISLLVQFLHDRLSRLIAVHARIFPAILIDGGVVVHDIDLRQMMSLTHFKVIRVVRRSDLHCSCTELFVHIVIRHDRNLTPHERQDHIFPDDILVSLIVRVHRDGSIPEHGLRTCGRDLEEPVRAHDRIFDVPEMSFLLLVLYFRVGERSLAFGTPVDDPGPFVNVSLLI